MKQVHYEVYVSSSSYYSDVLTFTTLDGAKTAAKKWSKELLDKDYHCEVVVVAITEELTTKFIDGKEA